MTPTDYIFYGFISAVFLIASLHGFFLAGLLGFHQRTRKAANRYLGLALFGISMVLLFEFLYVLELEDFVPDIIIYLPLYNRSVIAVCLYYFVLLLIEPARNLTQRELLWLIPIFLEVLLELTYIPAYALVNDELWLDNFGTLITVIQEGIGLIVSMILIPKIYRILQAYQRHLLANYSTTQNKSLDWLQLYLVLLSFIVIFWLVSYLLDILGHNSDTTFAIVYSGMALMLFSLGYVMILRNDVFQLVPFEPSKDVGEKPQKKLSSKTDAYYEHLICLMEEEILYTDEELNLSSLADKLNISAGYLSQIINEKEERNFFEFVNHYRVEAVKDMLLDESFAHYSILGIANECGFKTKSTFNTVFKKFTGQTPSSFRRQSLGINPK